LPFPWSRVDLGCDDDEAAEKEEEAATRQLRSGLVE
jgi:hypothetical protein